MELKHFTCNNCDSFESLTEYGGYCPLCGELLVESEFNITNKSNEFVNEHNSYFNPVMNIIDEELDDKKKLYFMTTYNEKLEKDSIIFSTNLLYTIESTYRLFPNGLIENIQIRNLNDCNISEFCLDIPNIHIDELKSLL